jgi:hypothetical protein
MEIEKYLVLILINVIVIFPSCNGNEKTVAYTMLEDISSNCYYIPANIQHEGIIYEVVIPNDRLFFILSQEYGGEFSLDSYIKMLKPILQEQELLVINYNIFEKITPYILPQDWKGQVFETSRLFDNNIQNVEINNELVLIKQLYEAGYIVYKDDETGLLVRKEYGNM